MGSDGLPSGAGDSADSTLRSPPSNPSPTAPIGSPSGPSTNPPTGSSVGAGRSKSPKGRWPIYAAITIAVVVIVVVAGTLAIEGARHSAGGASSSSITVLVTKDSLYILPAGQFASVDFTSNQNATVNGTIDQAGGINVYSMTPTQVYNLARTGLVSGYLWMTSLVQNGTVYNIDLKFASGTWDVVFLDPSTNPTNSSSVGFLSGLYLVPS